METLQLLGVALGFATLAGINLYLTVFLTGLAIRFDWITLAERYQELEILAHPAIIAVAGVMYFIEFFADKIPWLDSAWDTVHTVIRPVGGTLLAIQVLGESSPVFDVIVAMLACGMSLMTHSLKAGMRVVVNGSPEPASNIAVSLVEDAGVVGGLWLLSFNPLVALAIFVVLLAVGWYFAPRLFRAAKVKLWLAWAKLKEPASDRLPDGRLPQDLPPDAEMLLGTLNPSGGAIDWAVPCITGKIKGVPPYKRAYLVAAASDPSKLHLVGARKFGSLARSFELDGYKAAREPGFLCENLAVYHVGGQTKMQFVFERPRQKTVDLLVESINARLGGGGGGRLESPREGELAAAR